MCGRTRLTLLAAVLAGGALKRLKKRIDPRAYNGGMFLGLNGICVKSHGGMDSYGFSRALLVAADLIRNLPAGPYGLMKFLTSSRWLCGTKDRWGWGGTIDALMKPF